MTRENILESYEISFRFVYKRYSYSSYRFDLTSKSFEYFIQRLYSLHIIVNEVNLKYIQLLNFQIIEVRACYANLAKFAYFYIYLLIHEFINVWTQGKVNFVRLSYVTLSYATISSTENSLHNSSELIREQRTSNKLF